MRLCVYFVSIAVCLCLYICECWCVYVLISFYERKFLELKLKYHLMGNDLSLCVDWFNDFMLRACECVCACICVTNYALNKFNSDFRLLTLRLFKQPNATTTIASREFKKREKITTITTPLNSIPRCDVLLFDFVYIRT